MGEILTAFGIDWKLISIQIFNFTILAVLLWYFLYTPILNLLSEREQKIRQGIEDAEAAARAKDETEKDRGVVLSNAEAEAESVLKRSHELAGAKANEIVKDAEGHAADIIADAMARAEVAKQTARKESEAEVVRLAVLAAEKILREQKS